MEFGIKNIIFLIVFIAAFGFMGKNVMRLISYLKQAKPVNRFNKIGERIKRMLVVAFAQTKILRDKKAGPIHAGIFWGFLILLFSAANSIFVGFGIENPFNWLGPVYSVITILTDVFIFLIYIAVIGALWRRYVSKVERLQVEDEKFEAAFILIMIFFIVTGLLFENAANIQMGVDGSWAVRPFAAAVSGIIPLDAAPFIYEISYWLHLVLILVFMNYLPYSKHLHVLTSVPNVFFSNPDDRRQLETIDFEDETIESFGATDVEDLHWKSLLDGYTCTHCGRCTDVCPANITGKVLDPREVVVQIRERTFDKMPIMLKKEKEGEEALTDKEKAILDKKFVGEYENIDALWQCTTCGACQEECPVNIEHVPSIIEMRRSLAMMEADFSPELQNAFTNLENNASPWAFPPTERAAWAEGTGVKTAAEKQEFDVLFWVGCAGSFDDRAKQTTKAVASLLQAADIDFAILGEEEQCNGDPARRTGNEYLADMLVKANIETMNQYKFNKIVTFCPHCFNTLKNEFPMFGGRYEVHHHTQFFMDLIKEGKLSLDDHEAVMDELTYHDSCYMGRHNDVYDEPREILSSTGAKVKEVDRSKDKGLCCGAGGGQMFMEETEGKRVNIERTEELLDSGAKTIAVNCPFCMTMISDGVKTKEREEDVKVKDVSEILLEKVKKKNGNGNGQSE